MNLDWANILGLIGVGLILVAYFLLQFDRVDAKSILYSVINLLGAILILISLFVHWNLASFVIEIVWILISLYGLYRAIRAEVLSRKQP